MPIKIIRVKAAFRCGCGHVEYGKVVCPPPLYVCRMYPAGGKQRFVIDDYEKGAPLYVLSVRQH
jgi:hypothetical protein